MFRPAVIASIVLATLAPAAGAEPGRELSAIARADGYTYQWLPSNVAVSLTIADVHIILSAGRRFYDVNDVTSIADVAPVFDGHDLVVSASLARRLHEIAARAVARLTPVAPPISGGATGRVAHGALTLTARHIPGQEAVLVAGTGPANVPVEITLRGEFSTDLPSTVIRRITLTTGADGRFSVDASYGPDTHRYTVVAIEAASIAGVAPAATRYLVTDPSPDVKSSGFDEWPAK